jgi:hypothetical protein
LPLALRRCAQVDAIGAFVAGFAVYIHAKGADHAVGVIGIDQEEADAVEVEAGASIGDRLPAEFVDGRRAR